MKFARIVAAAVAATVVDAIYGFLVYGTLLANEFARFPGVYRSNEAGMAYLYAKGYDGGSGVVEGARFGVLLGIFIAAIFAGINYATLNIGRRHSLEMAVAGFIEWTLAGIAIGLVYKPSASRGK
jgi:hypothetical protein